MWALRVGSEAEGHTWRERTAAAEGAEGLMPQTLPPSVLPATL